MLCRVTFFESKGEIFVRRDLLSESVFEMNMSADLAIFERKNIQQDKAVSHHGNSHRTATPSGRTHKNLSVSRRRQI